MLTPADIQQANQFTGFNAPTTPNAPPAGTQSFADQIRAVGTQAIAATKNSSPTDIGLANSVKIKPPAGGFKQSSNDPNALNNEVSGTGQRMSAISADLTKKTQETANDLSTGKISTGGAIFDNGGNVLESAAQSAFSLPVLHGLASMLGNVVNGVATGTSAATSFIAQKVWDGLPVQVQQAVAKAQDTMSNFAKDRATELGLSDQKIGPENTRIITNHVNALTGWVDGMMTAAGLREGAIELKKNAPAIIDQVKTIAQNAASTASDVAGTVRDAAGNVVQKVTEFPGQLKDAAGNLINKVKTGVDNTVKGGKPTAEVLATPENQVSKLSLADQKTWFDNQSKVAGDKAKVEKNTLADTHTQQSNTLSDTHAQQKAAIADTDTATKQALADTHAKQQADLADTQAKERQTLVDTHRATQTQISEKANASIKQANADLQAKSDASIKQVADLKTEVDNTARDKAVELKGKSTKLLGEQSATYRVLHDADIAPYKDNVIPHTQMSAKIDSIFPDKPAQAAEVKAKLGIDTDPASTKTITVGELDAKIKEMNQEIGKGARQGNRVYTPEEVITDKVRNGLSQVLKEQGVDLSRSNSFWRDWAPLRDEIITKVKPFKSSANTFTNILKDAIEKGGNGGTNDNTAFVKALESRLGESITDETKAAMDKLSIAERQQLANQLDAAQKIEDAKIEKSQSQADAKTSKIEAQRELEIKQADAKRALEAKQADAKRTNDTSKNTSQRALEEKQTAEKRALETKQLAEQRALDAEKVNKQRALDAQEVETQRKGAYSRAFVKVLKGVGVLIGFKHTMPFIP